MEITTTMVRFSFPKKGMEKKTEYAQLFVCGSEEKKEKVWVPLTKLEIIKNEEDDSTNIVIMPKWLFLKGVLPLYTMYDEFVVTTVVNLIQ